MILSFEKEIEELETIFISSLSPDASMNVVMALLKIYLRGRSEGIDHAVRIVQRRAINPMPIVEEIRKPIR